MLIILLIFNSSKRQVNKKKPHLFKAGMGNFIGPRAVLKFVKAPRATLMKNQELKITFLHETQVDYLEK